MPDIAKLVELINEDLNKKVTFTVATQSSGSPLLFYSSDADFGSCDILVWLFYMQQSQGVEAV
jgi:hypothetical protein